MSGAYGGRLSMGKARKPGGAAREPQPGSRGNARQTYVSQSDVPRYSIQEASRVAQAIADNFASAPTKPLLLAAALDLNLNSSHFRMLVGASTAYGLTSGAWNSDTVYLTDLGRRFAGGSSDSTKVAALREGLLKPRVVGAFLNRYNNARVPNEKIALSVLGELGVAPDSGAHTLKLIIEGATELGLLREIKGAKYVDIDAASSSVVITTDSSEVQALGENRDDDGSAKLVPTSQAAPTATTETARQNVVNNRVFITHGKNVEIVNQLKELLTFGNLIPIVAAEHETISIPVPEKVMDETRTCSAGIIHVGKEIKLLDQGGKEHVFLNQNVLIEIGAAMALYRRRFILLVERGAALPSNLQGLYEVRYEGSRLDYQATMKLLKAFNEFRQ
jgi:predicted nucleotide-binding protein